MILLSPICMKMVIILKEMSKERCKMKSTFAKAVKTNNAGICDNNLQRKA